MPLIPCDPITVGPRQRKTIDRAKIQTLKDSISNPEVGLLNPIVVRREGDGVKSLITGFRRLTAIRELHKEKRPVFFSVGPPIPPGQIPATVVDRDSLPALLQMEFDENDLREDLTWQDKVKALADIVSARKAADPKDTNTALAKETFEKLGGPAASPKSENAIRQELTRATAIAAVLPSRPDLQKAANANQAYQILLREQMDKFQAELVRRKLAKASSGGAPLWRLEKGDLRELLLQLPIGEVDLILADPPYGIDIHKESFGIDSNHRYEDSAQYAMELCIFIIQEGWRLTKPKANLFMFCAWRHFSTLQTAAKQYGWQPWFSPLVWSKGNGHSPWGRLGFRHDYEILLWATKGQRGVQGPLSDVLDDPAFNRVSPKSKGHAAEKPIGLLEFLIEKSTYPHDLVLDPCAGSGSTIEAATNLKRRSIGLELDETYFNRATSRMAPETETMSL